MKFSTAALSVSAFLPFAMGEGLDESCFFMHQPPPPTTEVPPTDTPDRRRLEGNGFFANPNDPGHFDCADHQGLIDQGFSKYDAGQVCANLVDGEDGIALSGLEQCTNQPTQCGSEERTNPNLCPFDIHWTCKEHFEDNSFDAGNGDILKAVFCGTTTGCKIGQAVCALDPHFKTWESADSWYDYHGQCDLKYMSDPEFYMGLGLDIDIRTKARYDYSFIESAALKLGDDVFEFSSYGDIIYNGVEGAKVDGMLMADKFKIKHVADTKVKQSFMIHIHQDQYIELSNFKDMVSVKVHNATANVFGNTVGMMGDFMEGKMSSRDGKTVYNIKDQESVNAFGQEWQVLASEPNLFQTTSDPNQKCVLPTKTASAARRLGEKSITEEAAKLACAKSDHIAMCVYDVMATGDLDLASAGVY